MKNLSVQSSDSLPLQALRLERRRRKGERRRRGEEKKSRVRALEEEQRRKGEGRRRGEKKRKCEGRRRGEENVLVEEKKQGKCLTNGGQDNHMHLTWASSSIESTLFPLKFYREHPLSPEVL